MGERAEKFERENCRKCVGCFVNCGLYDTLEYEDRKGILKITLGVLKGEYESACPYRTGSQIAGICKPE